MERKTFVFYRDWYDSLEGFEPEAKQRIIEAIVVYALYGIVPTDPMILYSPFAIIRKQVDRDNEKYESICLRNRENAKKGGRPRKETYSGNENKEKTKKNHLGFLETERIPNKPNGYQENPNKPNETEWLPKNLDNDNDNDNDIVSEYKYSSTIISEPKGSVSTDKAVDSKQNQSEIDFNEIAREFNLAMLDKSIPQIEKMTDKRKSAVRARIKEYGKEAITTAIRNASESDFLNGDNNRGWKADFDWIFRPNNFPKVLEGNYNYARQYNTNNAASGHNSEAVSATEQRNDDFMQHILNKIGNAPSADNQALWQRDAIP